ncbi:MAG: hypothetical protein J6I84_03370 [Bacilli bacterium]|nr:hypothetical protein [Bacilli bacterium]
MELKTYTDYLLKSGVTPDEGYKLLMADKKLDPDQKKLIYSYCYPRKILDRELPKYVMHERDLQHQMGWLTPNHTESCILVEAFRSSQYGRFMRHLMFAFLDPSKINACEGTGEDFCPICGKKVYMFDSWQSINDPEQERLALISNESSVTLCKDCLVQLVNANSLLEEIEGPDYLHPKYAKRSWEDLKL